MGAPCLTNSLACLQEERGPTRPSPSSWRSETTQSRHSAAWTSSTSSWSVGDTHASQCVGGTRLSHVSQSTLIDNDACDVMPPLPHMCDHLCRMPSTAVWPRKLCSKLRMIPRSGSTSSSPLKTFRLAWLGMHMIAPSRDVHFSNILLLFPVCFLPS